MRRLAFLNVLSLPAFLYFEYDLGRKYRNIETHLAKKYLVDAANKEEILKLMKTRKPVFWIYNLFLGVIRFLNNFAIWLMIVVMDVSNYIDYD